MKNKKLIALGTGLATFLLFAGGALAAQPNQSCEEQTTEPNGFSTDGFQHAQTVYAGAGQSSHSGNPKAVSQYDVACFQLSN
jgi:hypothetical protein